MIRMGHNPKTLPGKFEWNAVRSVRTIAQNDGANVYCSLPKHALRQQFFKWKMEVSRTLIFLESYRQRCLFSRSRWNRLMSPLYICHKRVEIKAFSCFLNDLRKGQKQNSTFKREKVSKWSFLFDIYKKIHYQSETVNFSWFNPQKWISDKCLQ